MKIAEKICLVHEEFLTLPIEEKNLQKKICVDELVQNMKQINHFNKDICAQALKICLVRKLVSGEHSRRLIKRSRVVKNLLMFTLKL